MAVDSSTAGVGVRRERPIWVAARWTLIALAVAVVLAALAGQVFAGSSSRLAEGVTIAGVDVGGLDAEEALARLEAQAERLAHEPVVFTVAGQRFAIEAAQLGVRSDWATAVESAQRDGEGFGPVRGFKRLATKFFGTEIAPSTAVYASALDYKLDELAAAADRDHVEARLERDGLRIAVVPGQAGRELDRKAAARAIVRSLASLEHGTPVALRVKVDPVDVTAADLAAAAEQARTAVSAPVRLASGETRWRLPRSRIASLLSLPRDGGTRIAIAGPGAEAYFEQLRKTVERKPVDADFRVGKDKLPQVVPAQDGIILDVPATAKALLAAAVSPTERVAQLAVRPVVAERTTADAKAMGIERRLSSYRTAYAGTSDRVTNLQLGVTALDGTLLAPGETFSFNAVVGDRTSERGFRSAPVIYNNEYKEDIGGGVSQVATTVFNAAWEAGLKIVERNPHAFYISRYQLGRDATVNYPDLDLRFVNDTKGWLLLAGDYDASGITVSVYGGSERRKVVSEPSPLRVTGPPPVRRVKDPTLAKGKTVVEEPGSSSSATSVKRTVYRENGSVLYAETWNTSYRGESKLVRVGTKKPKTPEEQLAALLAAAAAAGATTPQP